MSRRRVTFREACSFCGKVYRVRHYLIWHMDDKHGDEITARFARLNTPLDA